MRLKCLWEGRTPQGRDAQDGGRSGPAPDDDDDCIPLIFLLMIIISLNNVLDVAPQIDNTNTQKQMYVTTHAQLRIHVLRTCWRHFNIQMIMTRVVMTIMTIMMRSHLKASVGEMRESGALEGDQAGAVGRQCHQTLRIFTLVCFCLYLYICIFHLALSRMS